MTLLGMIALGLAIVAGLGFALALGQLAIDRVGEDTSIGLWSAPTPAPPQPPSLPSSYASLLRNEKARWEGTGWERLLDRLDALGDDAALVDAPATFDAAWLEQRISYLETIHGPFPYSHRTEPHAR